MPEFQMSEGFHLDDAGHTISVTYVDLRESTNRIPSTTLVKACERRFAIEWYKRIRISKPGLFREIGENLIKDDGEGYATLTTFAEERVNHPDDLAGSRLRDNESNRSAELVGAKITTNTNSVKVSNRSHKSLTFGNNRWIFCTSIEPTTSEEMDDWRKTMPDEYDHFSYVYRPRAFARALGSMVAEQLGPQGKEYELKHTFDGEQRLRTGHRSQVLFHGPVIYVDNPYTSIHSAPDNWSYLVRSSFVKDVKYRDQREYRFVVLTEQESTSDTEDLEVTPAMLGAMEVRSGESAKQTFPTITWEKDSSGFATMSASQESVPVAKEPVQQGGRSLFQLADLLPQFPDPRVDTVPIAPSSYDMTNLPEDYEELTTSYAAVQALRNTVGGPFGRRETEATSAAWHIEPCIRHLCAVFEDPIRHIRITEDNFVVVTLKFPERSESEGTIAVGPHGTGSYNIRRGSGGTISSGFDAWFLRRRIEDDLREAGLPDRQNTTAQLSESPVNDG